MAATNRTSIYVYKQVFCATLRTNALSGMPNVQKTQAVNAKQMSDVIFELCHVLE